MKIVVSMATDSIPKLTMGKTKKSSLKQGPKLLYFVYLYVAMFGSPHYKLCQPPPGVQIAPGGQYLT